MTVVKSIKEELELFNKIWKNISQEFDSGTKRKIKKRTEELLKNANLPHPKYSYKTEGIIGRAVYESQSEVYKKRGLKPKSQEEIGRMLDVSAATISNRWVAFVEVTDLT